MHFLFQSLDAGSPEQKHRLQLFLTVEMLVAISFTLESIIEIMIIPANVVRWLLVIGVINAAGLLAMLLARAGRLRQGGLLFVTTLWGLFTYLAITENGIRSPTVDIAYLVIILVTGLLLDERAGIISGVLCGLTLLGMSLAGIQGLLPTSEVHRTILTTWEADVFYLAIVIGLQYLAIHSIRDALEQAHRELLERRRAEANLRRAEEERARSQMRVELHQLLAGQLENERLKIARELHDGPVQDLIGATFTLQELIDSYENRPAGAPPDHKLELENLQEVLREQIGSLRAFAGELRSPTLTKFGLSKAIREHLESFSQKHPEIAVQFQPAVDDSILPDETRLTLFRIYQEMMHNIVRHAQATQVSVQVEIQERDALLAIEDNGVGFDPPPDWMELARHGHLGLVGMRERVETIGGRLEIAGKPGQGTVVRVRVPVDGARPPYRSDNGAVKQPPYFKSSE